MKSPSRLLWQVALIAVLLPIAGDKAQAGDREFHLIVDRVSEQCHKQPIRYMGWLNFFANRITPQGISHFQMVIFDDVGSACSPLDSDFEASLTTLAGSQPFVRARNTRNGELTQIYVRGSEKDTFEMLILAIDRSDAVLMRMQLKPDAMREWMDEPVKRGRKARNFSADSGN